MSERTDALDAAGVTVIGVATREDYQARRLMESGVPFELLLDPDDTLRRALGIAGRFPPWNLLDPRGALDYLRAVRQARSFDPIWAEATQRPGVVLLDVDLAVRWSHVGSRIGDYPAVAEILSAIEPGGSPWPSAHN